MSNHHTLSEQVFNVFFCFKVAASGVDGLTFSSGGRRKTFPETLSTFAMSENDMLWEPFFHFYWSVFDVVFLTRLCSVQVSSSWTLSTRLSSTRHGREELGGFFLIFIYYIRGKLSPIFCCPVWRLARVSGYIYIFLVFYLFYKLWIIPLKFIIFKILNFINFTVLSLDEPRNFKFELQPQLKFLNLSNSSKSHKSIQQVFCINLPAYELHNYPPILL